MQFGGLRQAAGFAALGVVLALLGATAGSVWSNGYDGVVVVGDSLVGGSYGAPALNGAIAGGLVGLFLWAVGIRVHGQQGAQIASVVIAGLLGVVVGLAPVLVFAFAGAASAPSTEVILLIYAAGGVVAYVVSIAAVIAVLRVCHAPAVRVTGRTLAWLLPLGAVAATGAGVATAATSDFSTMPSTWVRTVIVVVGLLAATFAGARALALRSGPPAPETDSD